MTPYSAAGEMEPCPFCGEQPDNPDQFGGLWMVECPGCGATIDGYDTAKETADNWNRRAPVAVDAAAESKLASIERPEGIPNLPCPGWHEAIEEAAKEDGDGAWPQRAAPLPSSAEWRPAFKAARRIVAGFQAGMNYQEPMSMADDALIAARTLIELDCVLDDIKEYLEARHDIRDGESGPLPNEEMSLTTSLKEALGELP